MRGIIEGVKENTFQITIKMIRLNHGIKESIETVNYKNYKNQFYSIPFKLYIQMLIPLPSSYIYTFK